MSWKIKQIMEGDFGCEERMPLEPVKVIVKLENEEGMQQQFEVADNWLVLHNLDEGDEWPEEIDDTADDEKYERQSQWMDNYMENYMELQNN